MSPTSYQAAPPRGRGRTLSETNRRVKSRRRRPRPHRRAPGSGSQPSRSRSARKSGSSRETAGKYSPRSSRTHQFPVRRRSSGVVNRYSYSWARTKLGGLSGKGFPPISDRVLSSFWRSFATKLANQGSAYHGEKPQNHISQSSLR